MCASSRGERIDRCATAAPAGSRALLFCGTLADVLSTGDVLTVLALPQPLATKANSRHTQSGPARNALGTRRTIRGILGNRGFTHLLMTPFVADPSANKRRKVIGPAASTLIRPPSQGSDMFDRKSKHTAQPPRRASGLVMCVGVVMIALAAVSAAMALASNSTTSTLTAATNTKFSEKIVLDTHGRTLYVLSPETTHHLLCKSSECLKFWPPLTVHSRKTELKDGPGVHGHLGILRRSNGMLQVTLGGLPLYHFSGDSAKGQAGGENVKSFGGTWHVLSASTDAAPAPTATETTPTTPTASTPAPSTPAPTTTTTPNEHYGY